MPLIQWLQQARQSGGSVGSPFYRACAHFETTPAAYVPTTLRAYVLDMQALKPLVVDTSPAPAISLVRMRADGQGLEYLAADYTWQPVTGTAIASFPMTLSAWSPYVYELAISGSRTASWGTAPLIPIATMYVAKVPYVSQ